jgi:uncharacterized protein YdeI (YjbR/CyaY-like superfamily)
MNATAVSGLRRLSTIPAYRVDAMNRHDEAEQVQPEDRAAWRAWLAANHTRRSGVWLVTGRSGTGKPLLSYEDQVEEALAFGWIDSKARKLDDQRTAMWISPRKAGSAWSRPNKERVERLERAGLMTDAGRRAIESARQDGSWTRLDSVWDLVMPDELDAAFRAHPGSREQWEAFPVSARRASLQWIVEARTDATRARRVETTASEAAAGRRVNQ